MMENEAETSVGIMNAGEAMNDNTPGPLSVSSPPAQRRRRPKPQPPSPTAWDAADWIGLAMHALPAVVVLVAVWHLGA